MPFWPTTLSEWVTLVMTLTSSVTIVFRLRAGRSRKLPCFHSRIRTLRLKSGDYLRCLDCGYTSKTERVDHPF